MPYYTLLVIIKPEAISCQSLAACSEEKRLWDSCHTISKDVPSFHHFSSQHMSEKNEKFLTFRIIWYISSVVFLGDYVANNKLTFSLNLFRVLLPVVKLAVSLSVTPASPWPQLLMIVDTGCLFVIFVSIQWLQHDMTWHTTKSQLINYILKWNTLS